jgi:hypothetical protein
MKSRILLAAPAVFSLAVIACSAEVGPTDSTEATGSASQADSCNAVWGQCGGQNWTGATCCASGSTCTFSNQWYSQCLPGSGGNNSNCPNAGSNDAQMRAAATAAYQILKYASVACGNGGMQPCWGTSLLSSQHYRVASTGTTIEFDPSGPVYSYISNNEKAALAIAQLDSSTASFLVSALQWDQANTNGQLFAALPPTAALSAFTYPGNNTKIGVADPNAGGAPPGGRRMEVVTGSDWCGTTRVHFIDTSSYETGFAPAEIQGWSNWFGSNLLSKYKGGGAYPASPFNGAGSQNPYLVVSVNGSSLSWNSSSWPTHDCSGDASCNGSLDIDPIPYTQPGSYYDANGNLVGPQANPFSLVITNSYADPSHAGQWATKVINGATSWGTFSTSATIVGMTVYGWVKQY